jgi:hypothetical protein
VRALPAYARSCRSIEGLDRCAPLKHPTSPGSDSTVLKSRIISGVFPAINLQPNFE